MSRLENVIKEAWASRKGNNRAWIYNEDGTLNKNILCIDTLDLLEALKPYEVNVNNSYIEGFIKNSDSFYTYNWNCNITNDIICYYRPNIPIVLLNIHLAGDARIIYDTYFAIKLECFGEDMVYNIAVFFSNGEFYDVFSYDIEGTNLSVTFDLFSGCYNIYDYEAGEDLGDFWQLELNELLDAIKEAKERKTA